MLGLVSLLAMWLGVRVVKVIMDEDYHHEAMVKVGGVYEVTLPPSPCHIPVSS